MQRVLARRAREGDEARRQTRRPIGILPRARGRAAVAVEQLFEHDGRIRLARVLRVELALAHHLRARRAQGAEEAPPRRGERIAGTRQPKALEQKRARVLLGAHRIRLRREVTDEERRHRARRQLGRIRKRKEHRVRARGAALRRRPGARGARGALEQGQDGGQVGPGRAASGREAPRARRSRKRLGAKRRVEPFGCAHTPFEGAQRPLRVFAGQGRKRVGSDGARIRQVARETGGVDSAVAAPSGVEPSGGIGRHAREGAQGEVRGALDEAPLPRRKRGERRERAAERRLGERAGRGDGRRDAPRKKRVGQIVEQPARIARAHRRRQRVAPLAPRRRALAGDGCNKLVEHERRRGVAACGHEEAHGPRRLHRLRAGPVEAPGERGELRRAAGVGKRVAASVVEAHYGGTLGKGADKGFEMEGKLVEAEQDERAGRQKRGQLPGRLRRLGKAALLEQSGVAAQRSDKGLIGRAEPEALRLGAVHRRDARQGLARELGGEVDHARSGTGTRDGIRRLDERAANEQLALGCVHEAAAVAEKLPPIGDPGRGRLDARPERGRILRERSSDAQRGGRRGREQRRLLSRRRERGQHRARGTERGVRVVEYVRLKRHGAHCSANAPAAKRVTTPPEHGRAHAPNE